MKSTMVTNLDALGKVIGAASAMDEGFDQQYINSVIRAAHSEVKNAFDIAAAATAQASGNMSHMYEYGVPGITRGKPSFTSGAQDAAHLYVHTLDTRHDGATINYVFRPAMIRNPQPTVESTGVPSRFLKKLSRRKYVFKNRAFITETGASVSINGNPWLFVPFGKEGPRNMDNPNAKYNFMFYNSDRRGPIKARPGRKNRGAFSAFWAAWWAGEGSRKLSEKMESDIQEDFRKIMSPKALAAASTNLNSVLTGNAELSKNIKLGRSNTLRVLNQRARAWKK